MLIWAFKRFALRSTSNTLFFVISFDKAIAKYSALVSGASWIVAVSSPVLVALIVLYVFPLLAVGVLPAMYSVGSAYLEELGRTSETGSLFGAMSVVETLGENLVVSTRSLGMKVMSFDRAFSVFWLS